MSEQQDQPAAGKAGQEAGSDAVEATFEDGAAEMEVDSEIAEASAEDLARLLEQAQAKANEHYDQLMRAHAELVDGGGRERLAARPLVDRHGLAGRQQPANQQRQRQHQRKPGPGELHHDGAPLVV